ncbi:hypothetical protein RhiXN_04898 [Rhizoctonia solani]|uniref:Uncharacterized protein n=1 Tax=Rhizoctonia solani TaxID=456999 RepID=A0A8H8NR29_9AGAM|nr:uncharacterized protein RhiXN_04898 [Rhizoctonia solani]QRW16896.1 hypothetical protein RhiXN_04898 [Rhizoctonia solani]
MGRKKGGKNPEGHKAGGARMGAGRPRKTGPLTLKASIRVHAHQPPDPSGLIRRDAVHPALQAWIDIPATYVLRCCNCGHSDQNNLLDSSPPLLAADENPSTTSSLFSRSQSPHTSGTGEPLPEVSADFENHSDTPSLFTPPQSVSPVGSSISDPDQIHSAMSNDDSVVSHAESLLMLGTPAPTISIPVAHTSYELEPQELTPAATHPHSHLPVMQPNHIPQSPMTYNQPYIPSFISQNSVNHPDQFTNPGPDPQSPYRIYNSQPEPHFTPTSTTPPSFPGPAEPPLPSPQQQYYSPQQQRPPEFSQQQAQHFYASASSYPDQQPPEMYFPQAQALQQPQHIKPGPAAWRHAPHSTSIPPVVAAILSPQHTHPQQQLDPCGPVQFLPTGQHTQRRRRRCVICIGAGREGEADRCCGRGNRHLCPLYSKHGSPENIMEIRNAKHVRSTTAT